MRNIEKFESDIVDHIDQNGAATFASVKLALNAMLPGERKSFDQAFKNVFESGDLRIIKRNNTGTPLYQLPA